jgi:pimeloyl-ACP methyl ester carboxylesterase
VRVDEHEFDFGGSPVFLRSAGTADVPALFLHGIPTSSDDWVPFLAEIGGVAPDLIGFGRSGKGGHLDYTIGGLADFIAALLARLGIRRVRLVMHDWGAPVGLEFTGRDPDRVESLVLVNPLPLFEGFTWPPIARLWRRPLVGELTMGATSRRLFKRTLAKGGAWSDEQLSALWDQFDQGTQRAILRLHRSASPAAGPSLERCTVPALILWGEDDPWLPPTWGETYAASLPNASLERIPHARHWPWLDQPSVIERVARFLRPPP